MASEIRKECPKKNCRLMETSVHKLTSNSGRVCSMKWSSSRPHLQDMLACRRFQISTNMAAAICINYLVVLKSTAWTLNCPCHLYGSIYHGMHNWAPHRLVYSKVYVDMENLFLFIFCLRDLFVKNEDAPCYARPIHGEGALALS